MTKILVNIISDQAVPNIRFIKEFRQDADRFIFITTEEMEQNDKTHHLCQALNIPKKKTEILRVPAFRIDGIEEQLLDHDLREEDYYFVNITGGTKPMSIATLSFFSVFRHSSIYYLPIGEDFYRQVSPRVAHPEIHYRTKIKLREYLESYGLEIVSMETRPSRDIRTAGSLLRKIAKRDDPADLPEITLAQKQGSAEEKNYYGGRWFEEYIFRTIKKHFGLKESEIGYNIRLKNKISENEYDVIYIYRDQICIVECKAFFGRANVKGKTEQALYKLAALEKDFGIKAKTVFITTFDLQKHNFQEGQTLIKRASTLKIKFFQKREVINHSFLKKL